MNSQETSIVNKLKPYNNGYEGSVYPIPDGLTDGTGLPLCSESGFGIFVIDANGNFQSIECLSIGELTCIQSTATRLDTGYHSISDFEEAITQCKMNNILS
jgi:hypothetical protein